LSAAAPYSYVYYGHEPISGSLPGWFSSPFCSYDVLMLQYWSFFIFYIRSISTRTQSRMSCSGLNSLNLSHLWMAFSNSWSDSCSLLLSVSLYVWQYQILSHLLVDGNRNGLLI
jgi:hypothetical protein